MKKPIAQLRLSIVVVTAAVVELSLTRNLARAAADPGVFPIESRVYGKTYGQWVVAYWQWAMSIPIATSPWANDSTGEFAGVGQSGPVWFLGGSLGDSVTRTFTMPAGKAVFLPVHQWIFGASVFDCDPSNPGVPCEESVLRDAAADAATAVASMDVSIDGIAITNVRAYRTLSPSTFSVTVPDDNIADLPAGTYAPQVADGFYLILAPLSRGVHTISLHVVSTLGFEYVNTYNITVAAPPATTSTGSRI